jgi:hypothetical protein
MGSQLASGELYWWDSADLLAKRKAREGGLLLPRSSDRRSCFLRSFVSM